MGDDSIQVEYSDVLASNIQKGAPFEQLIVSTCSLEIYEKTNPWLMYIRLIIFFLSAEPAINFLAVPVPSHRLNFCTLGSPSN